MTTTFKLAKAKAASNKVRTCFHVLNSTTGDIVGSINVAPSEEADLLKHWIGPQPKASAAINRNIDPMVQALMKHRTPLSKAALLRS